MIHSIFAVTMFTLATTLGALRPFDDDCVGCKLFMVNYDWNGLYMGHVNIPGVFITVTQAGATTAGKCDGVHPNCTASPCKFDRVLYTILNDSAGGVLDVNNLNGTPRATLAEGDKADFRANGTPPAGGGFESIACGTNRDVLLLVHPNGTTYSIAWRCTSCPGSDPY